MKTASRKYSPMRHPRLVVALSRNPVCAINSTAVASVAPSPDCSFGEGLGNRIYGRAFGPALGSASQRLAVSSAASQNDMKSLVVGVATERSQRRPINSLDSRGRRRHGVGTLYRLRPLDSSCAIASASSSRRKGLLKKGVPAEMLSASAYPEISRMGVPERTEPMS